MQHGVRKSRWRRYCARILMAVAGICIALLLVEAGLRVFGHDPGLSLPNYLNNPRRVMDSALIMLDPRLRSDAAYETRRGQKVVVTLGDSFTRGSPVQVRDSYPAVLESLLADSGWSAQILNLGMGNTGPDQHLRLFEEDVLRRCRPDVVVWQFYSNDLYDNIRQAVYDIDDGQLVPMDATRHWLVRRQQFYDTIPASGFLLENSHLFRVALKSFESGERPLDVANGEWAKRKIVLAVNRMQQLSELHGFKVCYVLIAPQAVYLARSDRKWGAHFAALFHGVLREVLQCAPDLVEVEFEDNPAELFAGSDRDSNGEGDRHFNERGYRRLAERVAARVLLMVRPR